VCVYSLVTCSARDLKGQNSPSLGTPITIYRPPFGFEMSQIKPPKVRGIEKYWDLLWTHILPCATNVHPITKHARLLKMNTKKAHHQTEVRALMSAFCFNFYTSHPSQSYLGDKCRCFIFFMLVKKNPHQIGVPHL
jgi:hypothetical protein